VESRAHDSGGSLVATDTTQRTRASLPVVPAAAFVLVWSSGYIAGPYGVQGMSPLSLVAWRFILAAAIVAVLARVLRGPLRVDRGEAIRIAIAGFVMNGVQFGAMYLAFDAGLGGTLGALLHSLSPVLTAVLAGLLRERLTRVQVLGFVVGVAGVLIVLGPDIDAAGGAVGVGFAVVAVLALSLGTLGQRWIGHGPDPLWSAAIQFGVSGPPMLVLALLLEGTDPVIDARRTAIALAYLALVNSIAGLVLLGVLVRRRGAGAAASVFFLMPPVTAVMAWLVLGETLTLREGIGLFIAVVGVAAATRSTNDVPEEPAA
jgi:drug/metabolite transporter (DMT)-like permease